MPKWGRGQESLDGMLISEEFSLIQKQTGIKNSTPQIK